MTTAARRFLCLTIYLMLSPLGPLAGQRPGQPFNAPLKNFTVNVPNFAFGTRVQKSNNRDGGFVVFLGGFGDLERIDYARLRTGGLAGQDSSGRVQGFRAGLEGLVRANHAELIMSEPLSVSGEPMLYGLVRGSPGPRW